MTSPRELTNGPPRVAWVQRRISLDHVINRSARLSAERPAQRADNARRDRTLESVRIADGDGDFSDTQRGGVAQRHVGKFGRMDPDHRQIGVGIVPNQEGFTGAAVGERDLDPRRAIHDVAVREDESVPG